ncbi:hypothetical protein [Microcoleus sp. B4-C1]|uniref:hypothetical protein n=1 Tax=Microcoleus sp. B4-C1 TaxID=2818660 RepID=UPI002FCF6353
MPDRTRQIAGRISATSNPQSANLYTPSTASVLGTPVNYNGGMARIRVCAFLDSIPETHAPVILPTDTLAQKEQKNAFFRSAPKKGLMVYLKSPANENFEIGIVDIYNIKPCFLTGVSEFFSDLQIYGIQFGWQIFAEVVDRGYGILQVNSGENQQNDRIVISGFANESSSFLQGSDDVIYNYVV